MAQSLTQLKLQIHKYHLKDRPNRNCVEIYNLGEPNFVWNCDDSIEPTVCEYTNPLTDLA